MIRDVPHMSWDTLTCVNEAIEDVEDAGKLCARRRPDALKTDLAAVTTRSAPVARVHLLDLTAFMCDARRCFPVVGGALVSKDAGHLTRTFSLTMGPYLRRAMNATQVPAPLPAPTPTPSPTSTPSPAFISPPLNTTTP